MKYIIEQFPKGVRIRQISDLTPKNKPKQADQLSVRGFVTRFSDKSSSRLRDLLLESKFDCGDPLGFTCTIPGQATPYEWRRIMHRFSNRLVRLGLACIWRVELQKRGTPHLHCIGSATSIIDVGNYWQSWIDSAEVVRASDNPWFLLYGFCPRWLSRDAWLVYMCSHQTKHKQDQLGWLGRQWGVINRQKISRDLPLVSVVDDSLSLQRSVRERFGFDFASSFPNASIVRFGTEEFFPEIKKTPLDNYFDVW